jgi:hypothetical protein
MRRCSQTIDVRPQNTSRGPLSLSRVGPDIGRSIEEPDFNVMRKRLFGPIVLKLFGIGCLGGQQLVD